MDSGEALDVDPDVARASTALGRPVLSAERVAGSVANVDLLLRLGGHGPAEAMIMKIAPRDELAREAWTLRRLGAAGALVPALVALDLDARRPFLIMAVICGSSSQEPAVAAEAGAAMRAVHTVGLEGFGSLVVDQDHARGRYATWAAAMAAEADGVAELVGAGLLDAPTAERAAAVATGPLTRYDGPGVLLHRDLKPQHLLADRGRLTGVIDWGDAGAGDPVYDLARLSMAGAAVTSAFLAGYGSAAPDPRRLAAYRVTWNLAAMTYELRAGGDWFDAYRGRITADLDLLPDA